MLLSKVVMESTDVSYFIAKFYAEQIKKQRFEPEKVGGIISTQTIGQLALKLRVAKDKTLHIENKKRAIQLDAFFFSLKSRVSF
jgi:hypothetical protein